MYAHAFGDQRCVKAVFSDLRYALGTRRIAEQIREMVCAGTTSHNLANEMLCALRTLDAVNRAMKTGECETP